MHERIEAGTVTHREILTETMSAIRYPPFIKRLNQYLKESEEFPMDFKNEQLGAFVIENDLHNDVAAIPQAVSGTERYTDGG